MSPKAKSKLAREHLNRAAVGLAAEDVTEFVTWLLAALEAAIVALAGEQGMQIPTQHWKKAQVATELHAKGVVSVDFAATLDLLNAGRKLAVYEGDEPNLGDASLDDLFAQVESAVVAAESGA